MTHPRFVLALGLGLLAGAFGLPPLLPASESHPSDAVAGRFRQHVAFLASDDLEGRATGTNGAARAADYIVDQFQSLGLEPLGDDGSFFQGFPADGTLKGRNILALRPGRGDLAGECVIVSAHYDHLGTRPDAADAQGDAVFNGADDNASGIAGLLLVAEALSEAADSNSGDRRSVLFAAFDAEEMGLVGSRYYVEHPAFSLDRTVAVLNFDQIGRLRGNKVYALDAASCPPLAKRLTELGRAEGLTIETRLGAAQRSDQTSFLARRIPAFQLHTGMHPDYHQPSDEIATLDLDGGVRIGRVAAVLVRELAVRESPLPFRPIDPDFSITHALNLAHRLGMIPNVRAQAGRLPEILFVLPGSIAARNGLKAGDEIVSVNGDAIERAEDAIVVLTTLRLDRDVRLVIRRKGEEQVVDVPASAFDGLNGPTALARDDGRFDVLFRYAPPAGTREVFLAGTFNDWDPKNLRLEGPDATGEFHRKLTLEPGLHQYKFVVDGQTWKPDPSNLRSTGAEHNSVVQLGEIDTAVRRASGSQD